MIQNDIPGIICFSPHCGNKIVITIENTGKIGGTLSGAISGAIIGSKFGIAGGPLGAIAGTIPGFFLGALLGESVGAKIDDPTYLKCDTSFKIPQKSISAFKELHIAQAESKNELNHEETLNVIESYSQYFFSFAKENFHDVYCKYSSFKVVAEYNGDLDLTPLFMKNRVIKKPTSFSDLKKKFSSVTQLFGMNANYIGEFENEVNRDVATNEFTFHQYSAFLHSFKKNFYGQINNCENIIVSKILDINRNNDLYLEVLEHFLLTFYEIMLYDKFFEYHAAIFTDHKDFIQKIIVDCSNGREKSRLELVKKFPYEIDLSDIRT